MRDVLGDRLLGACLHGSAVAGGLRPTSDVDVLAVSDGPTSDAERRAIVDRLLEISGRRARRGPARPVELTIVARTSVNPWRYPPHMELQYGEWLRGDFEAGDVPGPGPNPDLAPLLAMALAAGRPLFGPDPGALLAPVPARDLRRAVVEGVPGLLADLQTDTRNVLLTLARIWLTLATGELRGKDEAASWAIERLADDPTSQAILMRARSMYLEGLGDDAGDWPASMAAVHSTTDRLVAEIAAAGSRSAAAQSRSAPPG